MADDHSRAQQQLELPELPSPDGPLADGHAVRFRSVVEEISPPLLIAPEPTSVEPGLGIAGEVTPEQLRNLSHSLQNNFLQERRMVNFAYEPFSLPASRTPSHDGDSREPSREHTRSSGGRLSPALPSPRAPSSRYSPPLTPAETDQGEAAAKHVADGRGAGLRPDMMTPQASAHDVTAFPSAPRLAHRPGSAGDSPWRPLTSDGKPHAGASEHRKSLFVGPGGSSGSSLPVSRDASPSRVPAAQHYTRPFTPAGDANDPYSANKRPPQKGIEERFIFPRKKKASSPDASPLTLPRVSGSEKRHSGLFSHRKEDLLYPDEAANPMAHSRQSSMSDLKRFFKIGGHHKMKRAASPAASIRSGTKTPPSFKAPVQIPFGDDHGLSSKYGKLGRVLGSGAGGSVRLMKRSEDNTVFAVKEFRPRHSYETEREYVKKLTAEYCIGSSLHHGNIIETLDIVQEKGKWYEVMEYAPYDLFAIVMTGKMTRPEVACCFLQILSGVTYLHSMGLAHRDLKLDNVVVTGPGIMKIIDFGSAHVFKYPFENNIVLASGIVGSDPYLAPEVYDEKKYDPTAVDLWSLAIIFCCMTLRRFPWKVPRQTDTSFKLFAAEPTPGHDPKKLVVSATKSTGDLNDTPARDMVPERNEARKSVDRERRDANGEKPAAAPATPAPAAPAAQTDEKLADKAGEKSSEPAPPERKEVIRGPWRILRLLPRETRHVIGRMLELNPKERIRMEEVLEDPWVANTVICRQLEPGVVIVAENHIHNLQGPTPQEK